MSTYVFLIHFFFHFSMYYVRQNEIQGRNMIFFILMLTPIVYYSAWNGPIFGMSERMWRLKPIHFVNIVCRIFIFWERDPSHQTFPSYPELTSAVILWKQDPCAELFTQWMDFNYFQFLLASMLFWSKKLFYY